MLKQKAEATPVFAPGLDNLAKMGAIAEIWDPTQPLSTQLMALVGRPFEGDVRSRLGLARGGRLKAGAIADRIVALAVAHG